MNFFNGSGCPASSSVVQSGRQPRISTWAPEHSPHSVSARRRSAADPPIVAQNLEDEQELVLCSATHNTVTMAELIEIEEKLKLSREDAAAVLMKVADSLKRHNGLEFERGGMRIAVDVSDQVELELELEVTTDGGSLEIEIEW